MQKRIARVVQKTDWFFLGVAAVLTGFGVLMIYSVSWPEQDLLIRQIIFLCAGIALALLVQVSDRHFWRNFSVVIYAAVLLLLVWLLVFGEATRGTRGWIDLGPISFQVAELAKIAVILFLATTLEKMHFDIANARHLVLVMAIVGVPAALILLQPDFGSAFIILVIGATMALFTGLDRKKLLYTLIIGALIVALGWFAILQDYQKERILTFVNPTADPLGSGYNVRQALVAIGSGGLFGRGLGLGTQSQLNFLPEQETDFIFASLAEELGFLGAMALLGVYVLFLWRMYTNIKAGRDLFTSFLVLGIFTMFLSQAAINIGMNMGMFPVTGIPLPFVSYGGSSLLISFLGVGLVMVTRE